jgi:hypothetical protein
MIVTKEQQEKMLNKYIKEKHNTDECSGFVDGINAALELVNKLSIPVVSTRIFRRGDKVEWRGMKLIVVEVGVGEVLIATSENLDDEGYNDWWVRNEYVE